MTCELLLLPVKPGSLADEDLQALKAAGVTVIYHDAPETLRLIRAESELSAGVMLRCAMQALISIGGSGPDAQRIAFARALAGAVLSASKPGAA